MYMEDASSSIAINFKHTCNKLQTYVTLLLFNSFLEIFIKRVDFLEKSNFFTAFKEFGRRWSLVNYKHMYSTELLAERRQHKQ